MGAKGWTIGRAGKKLAEPAEETHRVFSTQMQVTRICEQSNDIWVIFELFQWNNLPIYHGVIQCLDAKQQSLYEGNLLDAEFIYRKNRKSQTTPKKFESCVALKFAGSVCSDSPLRPVSARHASSD